MHIQASGKLALYCYRIIRSCKQSYQLFRRLIPYQDTE